MKIWFVTGEYPPIRGGIADYTEQLATHLAAKGHAITAITRAPQQGGPEHLRVPSIERPLEGVSVRRVIHGWGIRHWGHLRQMAAADRPDVVSLQYQAGAFDMQLAANLLPWRLWRLGIPTVTTMHDLRVPYLFPKAGPVRRWAIDRLLRDSAAVVTTNDEDAAEIDRRTERSPDYFRVIPLAAQVLCSFDAARPLSSNGQAANHHSGPVLVYFGMLNSTKGVDTLFAALAQVRASGLDARLVLAGEPLGASDAGNLTYRDALRVQAATLGITDAISSTGYLEPQALSATVRAADIAVLPFTDGASYRRSSLLTVLAHGIPVITTFGSATAGGWTVPFGSVQRLPLLRNGEECWLVPANDPAALTQAILRLSADPQLRQRLGGKATEFAAAFTWERVASEMENILASVVREGAVV